MKSLAKTTSLTQLRSRAITLFAVVLTVLALYSIIGCSTQNPQQHTSQTTDKLLTKNALGVPFGEHIVAITRDWRYLTLEPLLHPNYRIRRKFALNLTVASKLGSVKNCVASHARRGDGGVLAYIAICKFENGSAKIRLRGAVLETGGSLLFDYHVILPTLRLHSAPAD